MGTLGRSSVSRRHEARSLISRDLVDLLMADVQLASNLYTVLLNVL